MKNIPFLLMAIILFALSCHQTTEQAKEAASNDSMKYKIFPNRFLADSNIPQIAKDLYLEKIKPNDSKEHLGLLEKLGSSEAENGFYFLVITKAMKHTDGAYSEALGVATKEYVEQHPMDFFSYFYYNKNLLQERDLKNWAESVYRGIQISSEGTEREAMAALSKLMKSKCTKHPAYLEEIDRFLALSMSE
ncbi:MAG: hypothetical protein ACKVTZ_00200 [Bacteroidia bacterium]